MSDIYKVYIQNLGDERMKKTLPLIHHIEERTQQEIKAYFQPEVFIEYCRACKYYDKIWTCPPYDFDISKGLKGYRYAYIIGSKLNFKDLEGEQKISLERGKAEDAFNEVYHAAREILDERLLRIDDKEKQLLILLAGRCLQCSHCTKEKQSPCVYPEKAHYSLESLGFDVASICEEILREKLQWTKDSLPEYLTLVSAIFSRDKLNIQDTYNLLAE